MRISDWSSDVCSSDLAAAGRSRIELLLRTISSAKSSGVVVPRHRAARAGQVVSSRAGWLSAHDLPRLRVRLNLLQAGCAALPGTPAAMPRSEEHTSELQSLMRS